jgi:hypothetical protein
MGDHGALARQVLLALLNDGHSTSRPVAFDEDPPGAALLPMPRDPNCSGPWPNRIVTRHPYMLIGAPSGWRMRSREAV